jgi:hypothetical protein
MKLDLNIKNYLLEIQKKHQIYLEGNILKVIKVDDDQEFQDYLDTAIFRDKENRRKRLEITKQIQSQNKQLITVNEENQRLMNELQVALEKTEIAKRTAEDDLDVLQKKTQFELINLIVKVALWMIIGVGAVTSILYGIVLFKGNHSDIVESTWSNMFSILLTNSFSIIGTIMGVKYVTNQSAKE